MGRSPDVDPDLIKEILTEGDAPPTSTQVAADLTEMTGRDISAALVRQVLSRHPEWHIPEGTEGRPTALAYHVDQGLGPIDPKHSTKSHDLRRMRAWERWLRRLVEIDNTWMKSAETYVMVRLEAGQVTDYDPESGFFKRLSYPWEIGYYYRQPVPDVARTLLAQFVRYGPCISTTSTPGRGRDINVDVKITDAHIEFWKAMFEEWPER